YSSCGDRSALHSFPTRRSSDLRSGRDTGREPSEPPFQRSEREEADMERVIERAVAHQLEELRFRDEVPDDAGLRLPPGDRIEIADRKSTRLNSSHVKISYAVFC